MGYNVALRCVDCRAQMGILRGYESEGIRQFASEHSPNKSHHKEIQVDNGFCGDREWIGDEGFEEKVFPVDWPSSLQPDRYRERGY